MAQNDIHKLVLKSTTPSGAVAMYNTLWFREEIVGVAADQRATLANDFAGTAVTPVSSSFRGPTYLGLLFTEVRVQRIIPYEESVFVLPIIANNTGQRGGDPMPPLCAACITLLTARGGRSGRGRIYLPPAPAVEQSEGLFRSTYLGYMQDLMSALNNRYGVAGGYGVSGFRLGVWSRKLAGLNPPFSGTGFAPITGWINRPEVRGINRRSRLND